MVHRQSAGTTQARPRIPTGALSLPATAQGRLLIDLRDNGAREIARREDRGPSTFGGNREPEQLSTGRRDVGPANEQRPRTVACDAVRLAPTSSPRVTAPVARSTNARRDSGFTPSSAQPRCSVKKRRVPYPERGRRARLPSCTR